MRIIVAKPRGFCAGVERAIKCVERALERYGAPVYVLNHIVHNAHVVNELSRQGAVFVRSLDEVPRGAPLLFSAHGVDPLRRERARELELQVIDATCPLVAKVHQEARNFAQNECTVILIGKAGHDETIGTMGWGGSRIRLIQTKEDVASVDVPDPSRVAYITQTTLSVEDCAEIIDALKQRFPLIRGPHKGDICYATSNRQSAVRALCGEADLVLVVGDRASANSTRLAEVAQVTGKRARLIPDASAIEPLWFEDVDTVLITSGASVPETLVRGVIATLEGYGACTVEERELVRENVHFRLPEGMGS